MGLISRVSSRTYRKNLKMVQRIQYRRRLAWNTSSNQRKISKTPGGKLVFLYTGKKGVVAKCGDTGKKLQGVKANRAEPLDDPKPSPEPTVVAFPLTLLNDESPEPF